jgi:hypothetical protein
MRGQGKRAMQGCDGSGRSQGTGCERVAIPEAQAGCIATPRPASIPGRLAAPRSKGARTRVYRLAPTVRSACDSAANLRKRASYAGTASSPRSAGSIGQSAIGWKCHRGCSARPTMEHRETRLPSRARGLWSGMVRAQRHLRARLHAYQAIAGSRGRTRAFALGAGRWLSGFEPSEPFGRLRLKQPRSMAGYTSYFLWPDLRCSPV